MQRPFPRVDLRHHLRQPGLKRGLIERAVLQLRVAPQTHGPNAFVCRLSHRRSSARQRAQRPFPRADVRNHLRQPALKRGLVERAVLQLWVVSSEHMWRTPSASRRLARSDAYRALLRRVDSVGKGLSRPQGSLGRPPVPVHVMQRVFLALLTAAALDSLSAPGTRRQRLARSDADRTLLRRVSF